MTRPTVLVSPRIRIEDLVVPTAEEPFRRLVRSIAAMYDWELIYHTHNSKRSDAGWPDEVYGHRTQRRTVFAEIKSAKGEPSKAQLDWLIHLHRSGHEVALWRPQTIAEVIAVLGPDRKQALLPATLSWVS